jgi:hypothetical protein
MALPHDRLLSISEAIEYIATRCRITLWKADIWLKIELDDETLPSVNEEGQTFIPHSDLECRIDEEFGRIRKLEELCNEEMAVSTKKPTPRVDLCRGDEQEVPGAHTGRLIRRAGSEPMPSGPETSLAGKPTKPHLPNVEYLHSFSDGDRPTPHPAVSQPGASAHSSWPRGFQTNKEARAEDAAAIWLRQQNHADRRTKSEAFEAAKRAVLEVGPLSQTAFFDRVWPLNAPKQWRQPGRPRAGKS